MIMMQYGIVEDENYHDGDDCMEMAAPYVEGL
jgi:hypothetical protein